MNLGQLIEKLEGIQNLGFVKTHRPHDTGVGKTLEDLLGIKENNISLPDVGDVELKTKRIESGSMLTIATRAPKPRGVNRKLFEAYRYKDKENKYCLHSTVYGSRKNSRGFRVFFGDDRLILGNNNDTEAYWPLSIFDDVLKSKSGKILLVFAKTKGERTTKAEHFHYTEVYLLSGMNRNKFESAIVSDKLKVDIRIGIYRSGKNKGKYHDHGTGFRISKRDFLQLYGNYKQLI